MRARRPTVCVVKGSSQRATSGRSSERQPATSAPAPANTAHRRSPRVNTAAGTARFHRKRSSRPLGSTRAETVTAGLSWGWACGTAARRPRARPPLPPAGRPRPAPGPPGARQEWGSAGGDLPRVPCRRGNRTRVRGRAVARQLHHGEARPRLGEGRPDASAQPQQHASADGRAQGRAARAPGWPRRPASTGTGRSASTDAKSPCKASRAAVGAGHIRTSRPPSGRTSAMTTVARWGKSVAADAAWVAASAAASAPARAAIAARTSDHPCPRRRDLPACPP